MMVKLKLPGLSTAHSRRCSSWHWLTLGCITTINMVPSLGDRGYQTKMDLSSTIRYGSSLIDHCTVKLFTASVAALHSLLMIICPKSSTPPPPPHTHTHTFFRTYNSSDLGTTFNIRVHRNELAVGCNDGLVSKSEWDGTMTHSDSNTVVSISSLKAAEVINSTAMLDLLQMVPKPMT